MLFSFSVMYFIMGMHIFLITHTYKAYQLVLHHKYIVCYPIMIADGLIDMCVCQVVAGSCGNA